MGMPDPQDPTGIGKALIWMVQQLTQSQQLANQALSKMAGTTEKRDRRDLSHIYQGIKKCPKIAGEPKSLLDDYEKWETFVAKLGLSTWPDLGICLTRL